MLPFTTAFAASFQADPAHSTIGFEVKHLSFATVRGNFPEFSGSFEFDEAKPASTHAEFTIKTASISTSNAKRDEHLRSPEFFDASKFPEARFVSTSVKKTSEKKYALEGDLTIRDVTKKVKFDLAYLGKAQDPMSSREKAAFQATTQINRRDFGLNYGPSAVISDTVKLTVDLEAAKK